MTSYDPYQPPKSLTDGSIPGRPVIASSLLWGVGVPALLLLNGQHFTNTLIFLGCVVISCLLWTRFYFSSKSDTQQSGRVAVLFHVVIIFAGAVTLPKCYQAQMKFNNMANSAKNRAAISAED